METIGRVRSPQNRPKPGSPFWWDPVLRIPFKTLAFQNTPGEFPCRVTPLKNLEF